MQRGPDGRKAVAVRVPLPYKEKTDFSAAFDPSADEFHLAALPADKGAAVVSHSDGPAGDRHPRQARAGALGLRRPLGRTTRDVASSVEHQKASVGQTVRAESQGSAMEAVRHVGSRRRLGADGPRPSRRAVRRPRRRDATVLRPLTATLPPRRAALTRPA
jgi:hypothetical protein